MSDYKALFEAQKVENQKLQGRLNEVYRKLAARDAFVRWFATEYGLETFGRAPAEMVPAKPIGIGRWTNKFREKIGRLFA